MEKKEVKTGTIEDRLFWFRRGRRKRRGRADDKSRRLESMTRLIIFFAILGVLLSLYMTWLHYKPGNSSFCTINEQFDCEAVNKSRYSELFGMPVALLGVFGYFVILLTAFSILAGYDWSWLSKRLKPRHCHWVLFVFAALGFLVSVYLSIVQAFVLHTWCVICIASFVTITTILVLAILNCRYCQGCRKGLVKKGVKHERMCKHC
jgi:uncharacterized membrane protein